MKNRRDLIAMAACAAFAAPTWSTEVKRQIWPGKAFKPTVHLGTLDGGVWSLASQKGNPLLLNFWASWCGPCRNEMPSLEMLAKRYSDQGLQVMAVNYRETDSAIRRFTDTTSLQLPILRDDGAVAKVFGVHIFPSTVAISRNGQVRFIVVGECDWDSPTARRWVEEIL